MKQTIDAAVLISLTLLWQASFEFRFSGFALAAQAPRITEHPSDVIILDGGAFEMSCEADGEPEPQIEWFQNGEPVKSTRTRSTLGNSIQFLDVRGPNSAPAANGEKLPVDAGVYWCQASNEFGKARSKNATLQVACK